MNVVFKFIGAKTNRKQIEYGSQLFSKYRKSYILVYHS